MSFPSTTIPDPDPRSLQLAYGGGWCNPAFRVCVKARSLRKRTASQAAKKSVPGKAGRGFRLCVTNSTLSPAGTAESSPGRQSWVDLTRTKLVPLGTTECSPGRQSWVNLTKTDLVPLGTTEILCSRVQPSPTELIRIFSDCPGLTSGLLSAVAAGAQSSRAVSKARHFQLFSARLTVAQFSKMDSG